MVIASTPPSRHLQMPIGRPILFNITRKNTLCVSTLYRIISYIGLILLFNYPLLTPAKVRDYIV